MGQSWLIVLGDISFPSFRSRRFVSSSGDVPVDDIYAVD